MNFALGIFVIILAVSFVNGSRRGALKIIASLICWIFVLLFTILATPYIQKGLSDHTGLDEWIGGRVSTVTEARWEKEKDSVTEQLTKNMTEELTGGRVELPESARNRLLSIPLPVEELQKNIAIYQDRIYQSLPQSIKELIGEGQLQIQIVADQGAMSVRDAVDQVGRSVADQAAAGVTNWIMRVISFLIALLIARIIEMIILTIVDVTDHLPVIGHVSHLLGGLVGILCGMIYGWILMYLVQALSWTAVGSYWASQITQSAILSFVQMLNPLRMLF